MRQYITDMNIRFLQVNEPLGRTRTGSAFCSRDCRPFIQDQAVNKLIDSTITYSSFCDHLTRIEDKERNTGCTRMIGGD